MDSRIVLFLASNNSYESKFTNAELTFAFNEKPKHSVLPYIIDGSTMPPELRFVFSSINWRAIENHPIHTILIDDLFNLTGRQKQDMPAIEELRELLSIDSVYMKVKVGLLKNSGDLLSKKNRYAILVVY